MWQKVAVTLKSGQESPWVKGQDQEGFQPGRRNIPYIPRPQQRFMCVNFLSIWGMKPSRIHPSLGIEPFGDSCRSWCESIEAENPVYRQPKCLWGYNIILEPFGGGKDIATFSRYTDDLPTTEWHESEHWKLLPAVNVHEEKWQWLGLIRTRSKVRQAWRALKYFQVHIVLTSCFWLGDLLL